MGLHYVGEMGEGSPLRAVADLVTDGRVGWSPMPDPLERFVYPDLTFDQPVGRERIEAALGRAFPHERAAIGRYFRDLRRVGRWAALAGAASALPAPLGRVLAGLARPGA